MVDLHTHVLPNIDDGSSSYEETLAMLNLMETHGIRTVVATPHFDLSKQDITEFIDKRHETLETTKKYISENGSKINLLSGCELMFTPQLANIDLDLFTIENTDYVLIELSTRYDDPSVLQVFEAIIAKGFIPILAHVERYSYLVNDSSRIVEMINRGVIIQVNAKSIDNKNYPYINAMMKHSLVHLIGSDAHNMKNRMPNVKRNMVAKEIYDNMGKVVNNKLLSVNSPTKIYKFFNKFF